MSRTLGGVLISAIVLGTTLSYFSRPSIAFAADETESTSLFNGRDLTGWAPVGAEAREDWAVVDGCLVCRGKHHSWLRSNREYGDFRLELEYQVSAGANSGVYVHVPADGNHHRDSSSQRSAGFEIQILDDHALRYAGLKDYQYSASLYDIAGASPRVSKLAGNWNTLEIRCAQGRVIVVHNAVQVVDARPERFALLSLRNRRGYLGLQSHNGIVRFRNIRIESSAKGEVSPPPSR